MIFSSRRFNWTPRGGGMVCEGRKIGKDSADYNACRNIAYSLLAYVTVPGEEVKLLTSIF